MTAKLAPTPFLLSLVALPLFITLVTIMTRRDSAQGFALTSAIRRHYREKLDGWNEFVDEARKIKRRITDDGPNDWSAQYNQLVRGVGPPTRLDNNADSFGFPSGSVKVAQPPVSSQEGYVSAVNGEPVKSACTRPPTQKGGASGSLNQM